MSALDYPPPSYAGYIWDRGDALVIGLPGSEGGSVGHTIVLPREKLNVTSDADQRGWLVLLETLRARHMAYAARQATRLGTPDTPTSAQVEALLSGRRAQAYDARGREKIGDLWEDENGQ